MSVCEGKRLTVFPEKDLFKSYEQNFSEKLCNSAKIQQFFFPLGERVSC